MCGRIDLGWASVATYEFDLKVRVAVEVLKRVVRVRRQHRVHLGSLNIARQTLEQVARARDDPAALFVLPMQSERVMLHPLETSVPTEIPAGYYRIFPGLAEIFRFRAAHPVLV